jgi:hypothetical protein
MHYAPAETPERRASHARIDKDLAPLWAVLGDLIAPEPRSACQPARVEGDLARWRTWAPAWAVYVLRQRPAPAKEAAA